MLTDKHDEPEKPPPIKDRVVIRRVLSELVLTNSVAGMDTNATLNLIFRMRKLL